MNVEELNSIAAGDVLDEDTARTIQRLTDKTQKLPALWKQVYHIAGRTHFFATSISAEWEEGAKTEYFAGEDIDFSELHVYLHKDDEYTLEVEENEIEETSTYVPSITKIPSNAEDGEINITISYGSGSEMLSTTVSITVVKPMPLPVDIDYYEGYGYSFGRNGLYDSENDSDDVIVQFTDGSSLRSVYLYPNREGNKSYLPRVSEDTVVYGKVNCGNKEYDVPFQVRYHAITKEMLYDNSYANDDHVIYVCDPGSTVDAHMHLDNEYSNRYVTYYDDGKYKTSNYGTIDFSEEGLSIGEYTRKATVTFDDSKVFYKDIQISVIPSEFEINGPKTVWTNPYIYINGRQIGYSSDNEHFKLHSDTHTNGEEYIYVDESHEYPYTPTHQIEYITINDKQYDLDGNPITVNTSYRYKDRDSYNIHYELADTEGNKYFIGTGWTYLITPNGSRKWLNSGLSADKSVGDTVTINNIEYTITKVFDEGARYNGYRYVDPDEYQAWAEENGFIIKSE